MKTVNTEKLIEIGGKTWSKNGATRIYIDDNILNHLGFNVTDTPSNDKNDVYPLHKTKLYFDCMKNKFITESQIVRAYMTDSGYNCTY